MIGSNQYENMLIQRLVSPNMRIMRILDNQISMDNKTNTIKVKCIKEESLCTFNILNKMYHFLYILRPYWYEHVYCTENKIMKSYFPTLHSRITVQYGIIV